MQLEYRVSTRGADALWQKLEAVSGIAAPEHLRKRSGLLARVSASFTQPVADSEASAEAAAAAKAAGASAGGSAKALTASTAKATGTAKAAQNLGKSAVRRDIGRVYISPKVVMKQLRDAGGPSRTFSRLLKDGKLKEAEHLLRDHSDKLSLPNRPRVIAWDEGALHKQMRNSRGRVSSKKRGVIVDDAIARAAYEKKKLDLVGFTKSSWVTAAKMIPESEGYSSLPPWIKKHKAPGVGIDRTRGNGDPHVILRSSLDYIDQQFSTRGNHLINAAFEKLLIADLRNSIRYYQRKAETETSAFDFGSSRSSFRRAA